MRKWTAAAIAAIVLTLGVAVPMALAAGPASHDGRVLMSFNGPLDVPAGQHADAVIVANGDATIEGDVNTVVVLHGSATLAGATAEAVVVVDGTVSLDATTVVSGDVRTLNGAIEQAPGALVRGSVGGMESELATLWVVLLPALVLLFIGFALVTVVAALLVAGLAGRQTRAAEVLISRQPVQTLVAAVVGIVILPIAGVLVTLTVVGAPIGLVFLVVVLPAVAYLGWIVAAIWIGDWILLRTRGSAEPERPYLAAVIGVVVLGLASLLPPLSAIASLFGFGAVLLLAWKVYRHEPLVPGPAAARSTAPTPA